MHIPDEHDLYHCKRCGRDVREAPDGVDDWNTTWDAGEFQGLVRPECQTDEEDLGAQAQDAIFDYGVGLDGLARAVPKAAKVLETERYAVYLVDGSYSMLLRID